MGSFPVGAALEAGGGFLSSIISTIGANRRAKKQYEYQQKLQDSQNAFNLDMWNKNNAYNDPLAVAQRLSDAGFNPASQFGNAYTSSTLTSANPSFNMPQGPNIDLSGLGQLFLQEKQVNADVGVKSAQEENIRADTEKKRSEVPLNESVRRLNEAKSAYQEILNTWADTSESERINNLRESTKNLVSNSNLSDTNRRALEDSIPYIAKLKEAELKNLQAAAKKSLEEALTEVSKRYNLNAAAKASLASAYLSTQLGDSEAVKRDLMNSQIKINNATSDKIEAEIKGIFIDNFSKEFSAKFFADRGFPPGWTNEKAHVESFLLLNPPSSNEIGIDVPGFKYSHKSSNDTSMPKFVPSGQSSSVPSASGPSLLDLLKDYFGGSSKPRRNPSFFSPKTFKIGK